MYKDLKLSQDIKQIHTLENLKKKFPNCKVAESKFSHTYYQLEENVFCKVYYDLISGGNTRDASDFLFDDINYNWFIIDKVYKQI